MIRYDVMIETILLIPFSFYFVLKIEGNAKVCTNCFFFNFFLSLPQIKAVSLFEI